MKSQRGLGRVYQPKFRDRKTGEVRISPTWWLDYYAYDPAQQCRRKIRESANTTNKTDALKLLKSRSGDVAAGRPIVPDAARVTFPDLQTLLFTDYELNHSRGLKRMKGACKRLGETFGNHRAIDITTPRIDDYVKGRLATMKPATVQVELAALGRMFALAIDQGLLTAKPKIRTLKFSNARQGYFEVAEFEALLRHCKPYVQPIVSYQYFTGWRIQEVLGLTWDRVDFKTGTLRLDVGTTKNNEARTFPLSAHPPLLALLTQQRERVTQIEKRTARIIRNVFIRDDGSPVRDIRSAWATACRKAGLAGRVTSDFRRGAVRRMEAMGVPRSVAMTLTGHRTEQIYRRYAIVTKDQAHWVARLAQQHEAEAGQSPNVIPLSAAVSGRRG